MIPEIGKHKMVLKWLDNGAGGKTEQSCFVFFLSMTRILRNELARPNGFNYLNSNFIGLFYSPLQFTDSCLYNFLLYELYFYLSLFKTV